MVEGELITEPVRLIPPSPGPVPPELAMMNLKYINGTDRGVSKLIDPPELDRMNIQFEPSVEPRSCTLPAPPYELKSIL
jgi:hypothetical protein